MKTYHIDVTPEEDKLFRDSQVLDGDLASKQPRSWKTLLSVIAIHIAVLFGIFLSMSAKAEDPKKENKVIVQDSAIKETDKAYINQSPIVETGVPYALKPKESIPAKAPTSTTRANNLTKTYVIKKGDTLYSLSKKYKLNFNANLGKTNSNFLHKLFLYIKLSIKLLINYKNFKII